MITSIIGWIGVIAIVAANFPQLKSALKYGSKVRVSRTTYGLLLIGIGCQLVRALAVMEPIWITSSSISFVCIYLIFRKL